MAYDLSDKLVVAISSRALFDLEYENTIFEKEGIEAYTRYQIENENTVLAKGTAYITDVGMTGPLDGVIGVERENVINKFITGLPIRFNALEQGAAQLNAVLVDINEKTGKATAIERINLKKESAF